MAVSGSRMQRHHWAGASQRTSMDDWYIEVCKRNANKLSVVEEQPPDCRPRSGSFKYTVQFMTGKCIYVMLACNGSRPQYFFLRSTLCVGSVLAVGWCLSVTLVLYAYGKKCIRLFSWTGSPVILGLCAVTLLILQ